MKKRGYRREKDDLGAKKVPKEAYYGVQTKRALDNFPISGLHLQKQLIYAMTIIKKAAALTNLKEKRLDAKIAKAISRACDDILKRKLDNQFPVDVFQAGAGTSENMNVNEVIANRALELLHKKKGSYNIIHPNDHVNLAQSTNDVFHSAIHIAAYLQIQKELLPHLLHLEKALDHKAKQWKRIIKTGRTHLRDAVPMTLGQEFSGYAAVIKNDRRHVTEDAEVLRALNIGGTAIGTAIDTSPHYRQYVLKEITKQTKYKFKPANNLFEGTASIAAIATTHAALKVLAENLIKIANDLRLLSSGPLGGLNEIILPAVQPGSSIMPGKVNPAVAEMVDMVGFQVIGNDTTIAMCAQAGQLELNVMMPLAAYALLNSIDILANGIHIFTEKCVKGIKANEKKCREYVEKNPIIVTALTPYIGYQKAAKLAQRAYQEERSIKELILEEKLLDKKTVEQLLNPKALIKKT
ncbi:aspartate ammonia-lyase [Candidatus Woesearchaeota archaeon]|nr:aspartate ammonia-lyase [Candidatus Woesearchaeota archaeon]